MWEQANGTPLLSLLYCSLTEKTKWHRNFAKYCFALNWRVWPSNFKWKLMTKLLVQYWFSASQYKQQLRGEFKASMLYEGYKIWNTKMGYDKEQLIRHQPQCIYMELYTLNKEITMTSVQAIYMTAHSGKALLALDIAISTITLWCWLRGMQWW